MTGDVKFTNGLTYAGGATEVLNGMIIDIIDQDNVSYNAKKGDDTKAKLGYVETPALNPEQTFTETVGAYEIDEINEGQSLPLIDVAKGPDKGFAPKMYGSKLSITKYFMKWLEKNQNIAGADSSIQAYYQKLASATINLAAGARKARFDEMVRVLTGGWAATAANGPSSPTAYGKALFASDHPIMEGTASFSNILNASGQTVNKALSATSLQWALDNQKNVLKLQNGDFVNNEGGVYELRVPRALEQTARAILQQAGQKPYMFAYGSNINQLNTFTFYGNTVELKVIPQLGRTLKDGTTLGASTYWFVANKEGLMTSAALRFINFRDDNVETEYDFDTKNYFTSIDFSIAADHYGAQYFIVGSQGTA